MRMKTLVTSVPFRHKPSVRFRLIVFIIALLLQVSGSLMAQMTPPGNALKMFYNATDLGFTYVTVPNASGLISGSSFTVEGWVYPMQQSFGKGQNGLEMYNYFFGFRNETNCDFYIMQTAPDKLEARFRKD